MRRCCNSLPPAHKPSEALAAGVALIDAVFFLICVPRVPEGRKDAVGAVARLLSADYNSGMFRTIWFGLVLCVVVGQSSWGQTPARYEARWWDGTRLEHDDLNDWHNAAAQPRLGDRPLFAADQPMMWLFDRRLSSGKLPEAFIEMTAGDRLPGIVTSYRAAGVYQNRAFPSHFTVQPSTSVRHPEDRRSDDIGVDERFVRRIVWQRHGGAADRYEPGHLFYRDGRVLRFRAVRFEAGGVRLLTEDGARRAVFGEMAELHLPRKDFWESYFDELALGATDLEKPLLQIETVDGVRVTASLSRFSAKEASPGENSPRWYHALQPAWSLSLLWIPHRTIFCYRSFAPHQVPLSRIIPVKAVFSHAIGGPGHWQVDRSIAGKRLSCGGQTGGWGFGLHASAELHFPMPNGARKLRSWFGIDSTVGDGGCVQLRILWGDSGGQALYESPVIVGSKEMLDTGELALPSSGTTRVLIVQFDAVARDAPESADPFNIRDMCNLSDPFVELDREELARQVAARSPMAIAAWRSWDVMPRGGAVRLRTVYDETGPDRGLFVTEAAAEGGPIVFRQTATVPAACRWFVLGCSVRADYSNKVRLAVRVAGEPIAVFDVPVGHARDERMLAIPIDRFAGQRVSIEVEQQPADPRLSVYWRRLDWTSQLPNVFRLFDEDEGAAFSAIEGGKQPEVIESDHYTGRKCVRLPAGGRYRLRLDEPLTIRSDPRLGEFRMLRMALRKRGGGRLGIGFQPEQNDRPSIFEVGQGPPLAAKAQRVSNDPVSDVWFLYTRDLIGDFGEGALEAIIFDVPDGEDLLVDHVFVLQRHEDLRWLPPDLSWHSGNADARRSALENIEKHTRECIVGVAIDGRRGNGVLVGEGNWVLTAGHLLGKPGTSGRVVLHDGREIQAEAAGIDRANNLGLLRLREKANLRSLEIASWEDRRERHLHVAWWQPVESTGLAARATPLWIESAFFGTLWAEDLPEQARSGTVLIDADGRVSVVGVLTRRSRFGGTLFSKAQPAREQWDRLCRGEAWGSWLRGAGPSLGVRFALSAEGCRVEAINEGVTTTLEPGDLVVSVAGRRVEQPAEIDLALAEASPGDSVPIEVRRRGEIRKLTAVVVARPN